MIRRCVTPAVLIRLAVFNVLLGLAITIAAPLMPQWLAIMVINAVSGYTLLVAALGVLAGALPSEEPQPD